MKSIIKYKSGQSISELKGIWSHQYFENGAIKAAGITENELMEGEWKFYRKNGKMWQIGNFSKGIKHGLWTRFGKNGNTTYKEEFIEGKNTKTPAPQSIPENK